MIAYEVKSSINNVLTGDTVLEAKMTELVKHYERKDIFEVFFLHYRKYGMHWANATLKEQQFVEAIVRVTYERDRALRLGTLLTDVRPSFAS